MASAWLNELDTTYLGDELIAEAIALAGSVWSGQKPRKISNVLRPNRNALAWLLSSLMNAPTAASANGACQPPWVKASLGSSSGPPGACITPSRVRNV